MYSKKVGILNFQYSNHNYGAVLQAAALEYTLRGMGHSVMHIDYLAKPKNSLRGKVGKILRALGLRKNSSHSAIGNQEAFERFRTKYINRTPRIETEHDFVSITEELDAVIVGSDQVWRPSLAKDAIAFFLGYVPSGVARISYAASFGTAVWEMPDNIDLTRRIQNELGKFKAISCRESSGVDICKNTFKVDAVEVLDPLLLVHDAFVTDVTLGCTLLPENTLVYYKLDTTDEFRDDVNLVADDFGERALNIYYDNEDYREVNDWLSHILSSSTVITDSFHCICIGLRFSKDVIYCPNPHRGQTRLDSLFNKLDIAVIPLDLDIKTPMFRLSPKGDVKKILLEERRESLGFLEGALRKAIG